MIKAWFRMGGYAALTASGAERNHSQERNLLCVIACTAAIFGSIRSMAEAWSATPSASSFQGWPICELM
eukprot:2335950-Pyramimonas_sp.AAC.1